MCMQILPRGVRSVLLTVAIVLLLGLPLAIILIRQPAIFIPLRSLLGQQAKPITSKRYSVSSEVPGYSIHLVDSQYLDYITAKLDVFGNNKIVDPHVYQNESWNSSLSILY